MAGHSRPRDFRLWRGWHNDTGRSDYNWYVLNPCKIKDDYYDEAHRGIDLAPLRDVASWQSYLNVVATVGRSLGGPTGGFLADTIGWRW